MAQINNRYIGSKNQSSDINVYNPRAGTSSFGDPINIGTYGKTSPIEVDDTVIYEYEWAGGTTPEIFGFGAYKMGKLLNVKTVDDVRTINPGIGRSEFIVKLYNTSSLNTDPSLGFIPVNPIQWSGITTQSVSEYYYTLNSNNTPQSSISIFPYETSQNNSSPNFSQIVTQEFGVPHYK